MQPYSVVIIGLSSIGLQLLHRLPREFEITCIDSDPSRQQTAYSLRETELNFIIGDATSRLVLEEATVNKADIIIITLTREKVNLEIARILKEHFSPKRIISIGITPTGIKTLEAYGAEVENIFTASVVGILNMIGTKSKSAHGIGLGKNEIREVEIHPNSKLANKPLNAIASLEWRVGIIYRDGAIVIPGGDTVLKPRDRVVILGEPDVLNTVAEILTFRFQNFPLEYGETMLACIRGGEPLSYFEELRYLSSVFPLKKVIFMYEQKIKPQQLSIVDQYIEKQDFQDIEKITLSFERLIDFVRQQQRHYGFIVFSKQTLNTPFAFFTKKFLVSLSETACSPVILAGGTFPYTESVVTCIQGVDVTHVMEHVFELVASLHNRITALLVEPSQYIASDDDLEEFSAIRKNIVDLSHIYKLSVGVRILKGNPVKVIPPHMHKFNLFLVDPAGLKQQGWIASIFNPDVVWSVIRQSSVSTLIIPEAEEAF